jgi:hypothetical protein
MPRCVTVTAGDGARRCGVADDQGHSEFVHHD